MVNIIYNQNTYLIMDSLLMSRIKKDVSPAKLQNLSPEKYGKAAWANLTYTPSKLADNVIYRQVTTMRKTEQGTNKLRQFEAMNGFMKERLAQVQLQRDGIERSLNQQVAMYKKMLHDSQFNHEQRLKEIQKRFNSEITLLISQKEEQAKYSQAQKQILQDKIAELQISLKNIEQRQSQLGGDYDYLKKEHERLTLQYNELLQKLTKNQRQRLLEQEESRKKLEQAQKKLHQTEIIYQERIQNIINQKTKQKQSIERMMRTELEKAQNARANQNLRKSQELRDIMQSFDIESKRLNEIISLKDRMLETLTFENAKSKENILDITQSYESSVAHLASDRNNLTEQVQKNVEHIHHLESDLDNIIFSRKTEKQHYQNVIGQLKQELQLNQVNFVRERDRFQFWGSDLEKEMARLNMENMRMGDLLKENQRLAGELRNLRDLLVESSFEIERSKQQLMRMAFQRDNMVIKAEKVISQTERIYKMKRELEGDSMNWRNIVYNTQRGYR